MSKDIDYLGSGDGKFFNVLDKRGVLQGDIKAPAKITENRKTGSFIEKADISNL